MKTTTLGRTGLEVSIAGLGGGGHSRLGLSYGKDDDHAVDIIRAFDLGVNVFDTAVSYGTEPHFGRVLDELGNDRDRVVVSSKCHVHQHPDRQFMPAAEFIQNIEQSLTALRTDRIDIYHLHAVRPEHYDHAKNQMAPVLQRAQEQGKVRHLAISEVFESDRGHHSLTRALEDDLFDVVMVGFNPLNPSARRDVFPLTQEKNVGTLGMFAVRQTLTRPERLRAVIDELVEAGHIPPDALDRQDPLGFLGDVVDAGYRFSAHEPGLDVVLFGTGNPDHLEANLKSINAAPLPAEHHAQLTALFGHLDTHCGN